MPTLPLDARHGALITVALMMSASIGDALAAPGAPSIMATIVKWTPLLAQGFALNIAMSFLAMAIGTLFGVALGLGQISLLSSVRTGSWLVTQFFRNSPWLVLLFYCMLLLPFELRIGDLLLGTLSLGPAPTAKLTSEGGYVIALVLGLVIANFFPRLAEWLSAAIRPELYIKIAIVILGASLAVTAVGKLNLATSLVLRGLVAIVEAYLIYWAVVYFVARKWFGFSREWSAPLASGISICGVSAAIATGGAIRARPVVPVLVSSLVVIFAVVEVLILPFLAETFLSHEPLVAGAWLGLAVKTDGAALAAGGITDALILAKAASEGVNYQAGWILGTTATVKVFIDIFIGVWTFILGYIWTNHIDRLPGSARARPIEIWQRFPKFILGFLLTFVVGLAIALSIEPAAAPRFNAAVAESNVFRVIFFILTFFSIGVLSNFRRLWEQGLGKLAAVYFVSLFGFVIWVGLLISWLFFAGVKPPLAS